MFPFLHKTFKTIFGNVFKWYICGIFVGILLVLISMWGRELSKVLRVRPNVTAVSLSRNRKVSFDSGRGKADLLRMTLGIQLFDYEFIIPLLNIFCL